jgi:uracil-DNA glycosylase
MKTKKTIDDIEILPDNKKSVRSKSQIISDEIPYQDISDSDLENDKKRKRTISQCKRVIPYYLFIYAKKYPFMNWKKCLKNGKIKLRSLLFNPDWDEFFDQIEHNKFFKSLETHLTKYIEEGRIILPWAELVFNIFNILSPQQIRVVFIGQDPYADTEIIDNERIPQATGCSFSIPLGFPISASLRNIFKNLHHFGHIQKIPDHGCLAFWISQGCFMMNATLTTFYKKSNSHVTIWKDFTNNLIHYLNNKFQNLVFVAWGKNAHQLCLNIDLKRHHIITSSHPSPFSCVDPMSGITYTIPRNNVTYPSFQSNDHFGQINEYFKKFRRPPIYWDNF